MNSIILNSSLFIINIFSFSVEYLITLNIFRRVEIMESDYLQLYHVWNHINLKVCAALNRWMDDGIQEFSARLLMMMVFGTLTAARKSGYSVFLIVVLSVMLLFLSLSLCVWVCVVCLCMFITRFISTVILSQEAVKKCIAFFPYLLLVGFSLLTLVTVLYFCLLWTFAISPVATNFPNNPLCYVRPDYHICSVTSFTSHHPHALTTMINIRG